MLSMFKVVVPIVKCHHERIDGEGYPEGLKRNPDTFSGKDYISGGCFDAMMSDRHYRSRLDLKSAIKQLIEGSGTQFDPDVVHCFVSMLDDYAVLSGNLPQHMSSDKFSLLK